MIPLTVGLLEAINRFVKLMHHIRRKFKIGKRFHVNLFFKVSMKKGRVNVQLVNMPVRGVNNR